jgi:hypothetical protein
MDPEVIRDHIRRLKTGLIRNEQGTLIHVYDDEPSVRLLDYLEHNVDDIDSYFNPMSSWRNDLPLVVASGE